MIATVFSLMIGLTPPLKGLLYGDHPALGPSIASTIEVLGGCCVPVILLGLGAKLSKGPVHSRDSGGMGFFFQPSFSLLPNSLFFSQSQIITDEIWVLINSFSFFSLSSWLVLPLLFSPSLPLSLLKKRFWAYFLLIFISLIAFPMMVAGVVYGLKKAQILPDDPIMHLVLMLEGISSFLPS